MAFAAILRKLREQAGLAQVELAAKAGINRSAVAKLERGEREPSWATVQALAKALGITPNDFLEEPSARPTPKAVRSRKASTTVNGQNVTKKPAKKAKAKR